MAEVIRMNKNETVSNKDLKVLAEDVIRLSRLLTREREELPAAYLRDQRLRQAYLAYFLPSNLSKIHKPLHELSLHPRNLLLKERLRILDIGSGPGTATLGLLDFFSRRDKGPRLEFLAIDQVAQNLRDAEELFKTFPQRKYLDASLKTVQSTIANMQLLLVDRFDIIILSNVLNEIFAHDERKYEKRTDLLCGILKQNLADGGSFIIIEPALRETSRDLLEVRDGLVGRGFHIYSPCAREGMCPALANPRDWCHEDVSWEPTPLVREIDRLTGLRKDSLKFSYLILRNDGAALRDNSGEKIFRVVSEPLVSKGKREFYVCGVDGRKLITRLNRDATPVNEEYTILGRGSVVTFERLVDEGKRYRVTKDTKLHLFSR